MADHFCESALAFILWKASSPQADCLCPCSHAFTEFEISAWGRGISPSPQFLLLSDRFQTSGSLVHLYAFANLGPLRVLFTSYGS